MENKLLREKIRDLDLRISDLAEYLKISRPTLYKYIDMYEEGNRSTIDTKILNLFDYIQNSKNIGSNNVIYYIMNNIVENSNTNNTEEDKRMKIKSLLKTENKTKEDFIYMLTEDNFFDPILDYLMKCKKLSTDPDKKLSEEDYEFISPLMSLYKSQGFRMRLANKDKQ
ncbi:helix-turn-helix transcriptional regulator [Brachyspira intermedia]|uniref:helix-turn-helix transcriptional regulator n=1 Tax=Brachyspira intermedia TaxID=84377 RepID=UPI0030074190